MRTYKLLGSPLRFWRAMVVVIAPILASIAISLLLLTAPTAYAAGTITGRVFQDFNGNGQFDTAATIINFGSGNVGVAVDRGIGGVVVTAFDANGNNVGTTTSVASTGLYALTVGGTGPYRLEFSNLPAGFQPSARGPNNGTSVQFVPDGNTSNVDFAILKPGDYCQNNPELATSCYVFGNQLTGAFNLSATLVSFPYSAGSNVLPESLYDQPTTHTIMLLANQIGTTWGLAYARSTGRLYAAAYMKKHTGFGPGGPGSIYAINTTANTVVSTFAVPGATTNAHDTTNYITDNGNTAWSAIGKTSLGGLDISPDDATLYVMNLENRTLYALNASTGAVVGSQAVPLNPPSCPAASDVRPFAVQVNDGVGYIGMVCSAESTQNPNDLRAYVYSFNLSTLAISASPVFQFPLNYPRATIKGPSSSALWRPWIAAFPVGAAIYFGYPQPLLTGLAFDNGNLILGLRDRLGDQAGNAAPSDPASPTILYYGITAGDTLRACGNPTSGWTLESNASCGGITTLGANTGEGPGTGPNPPGTTGYGEYYFADGNQPPQQHDELSLGGLVQVPGFPDVVSTVFNPIVGSPTAVGDGGARWWVNNSGAFTKGYRLFDGQLIVGDPTFGKSNGLGDLLALCNLAPIEIGNRVWLDVNKNGRQDPGEAPLANVVVGLYSSTGVLIATVTTNANGEYYFSSAVGTSTGNAKYGLNILPNTSYEVRILTTQAVLNGYTLTTANSGGDTSNNAIADVRDSDASLVGSNAVIVLTTGAAGFNNHGYDFGFYAVAAPQNLSVSKSVSGAGAGGVVKPGDTLTFTLTMTNSGAVTLTNVTLSDPLPVELVFVAGSATPPQTSGPNPLVWTVSTLVPGQVFTVQFLVVVQATSATTIQNVATVTSQQTPPVTSNVTVLTVAAAAPPAQVPEGDTLVLVGTGLAGLAGYASLRWRARRRQQP